jgi:hypothetical protein
MIRKAEAPAPGSPEAPAGRGRFIVLGKPKGGELRKTGGNGKRGEAR